jgi:MFS transporter, SP family, sugar:H+ symporter
MRSPAAIATLAAVGGFLFGFDTAVINGAVSALAHDFHAGEVVIGLTVSSALIGCAVGAYLAGDIADRYGRTRTMIVAAVIFVLSGLLSGAALGLGDLAVWRFAGGIAIGVASVIAPAYIAEIAPARMRGRLGSLQQLAIVLGIFAALLGDYVLAKIAGGAHAPLAFGLPAWRFMFWTEVLPALVYGVGALVIPESPRWLVAKGRDVEARAVLAAIGEDEDKLEEIRQTVLRDRPARLRDLRGGRLYFAPIVWTGIVLAVLQQLVGINVIFYYSSVLWQSVGFSESDALAVTVFTSITNVVTTLIAIATVDRFGRRPLLLLGSIGMGAALLVMAVVFSRGGDLRPALVAANVFVFFFGFSWGPVVWVLLGEMFNNRMRAKALAVSAAAQWLANFAISTTFPVLAKLGLPFAYGAYAGAAFVSFAFVLVRVRETKGRELEEM